MRKTLLSSFVAVAGFGLFTSTTSAQTRAPAAPAPTYFMSNGVLYRTPARVYYAPAPVYYSSVNPNGAMTGRISHNFDPTGRGIKLHKPWLTPLR